MAAHAVPVCRSGILGGVVGHGLEVLLEVTAGGIARTVEDHSDEGGFHLPELGDEASDESTFLCYWARVEGLSGEFEDIIANGISAPVIVTIAGGDTALESNGCGDWFAVDDTLPAETTPPTPHSRRSTLG